MKVSVAPRYSETITLPRAVRFPVELIVPEGFDPERLETWPSIPGRMEVVGGRLLYMPPCGEEQQEVVSDVVVVLGSWRRKHPEFVLGTNEAGMRLGGETRAADAAVWRRADVGRSGRHLRRQPPVLAVEVAGADETEDDLRSKAQWYLQHGVEVVWVVVGQSREVVVFTPGTQQRYGRGSQIAAHASLPGLTPSIDDFFVQLEGG